MSKPLFFAKVKIKLNKFTNGVNWFYKYQEKSHKRHGYIIHFVVCAENFTKFCFLTSSLNKILRGLGKF